MQVVRDHQEHFHIKRLYQSEVVQKDLFPSVFFANSLLDMWQEYVAAAAPLLFQGGEVEGTPAWQRLKLMAQYYWEVRTPLPLLNLCRDLQPDSPRTA